MLWVMIFIILFIFIWTSWWQLQAKVKEYAHRIAINHCKKLSVVLLDDTIVLQKVSIMKHNGNYGFKRIYAFEYSYGDFERQQCVIHLFGTNLIHLVDLSLNEKFEKNIESSKNNNVINF